MKIYSHLREKLLTLVEKLLTLAWKNHSQSMEKLLTIVKKLLTIHGKTTHNPWKNCSQSWKNYSQSIATSIISSALYPDPSVLDISHALRKNNPSYTSRTSCTSDALYTSDASSALCTSCSSYTSDASNTSHTCVRICSHLRENLLTIVENLLIIHGKTAHNPWNNCSQSMEMLVCRIPGTECTPF